MSQTFAELYGMGQKSKTQIFFRLREIMTDFHNFLHGHILWKICNKLVTKYTTTP